MANTKTNILKLTLATDLTTLFTEWITILNNNNVIIDSEAGNFRNAITRANQQIQEIINNLLNYYTKTEIDNNFYTKDNVYAKTETYNKDEVYNTEQTYTKTEINDLIGTIARLEIKVVDTVEEVTEAGYIYLVPKESKDQKDVFDEYIFYNNKIELIGTTQIDLSNYYTKDEVDNLLKDKANVETVYNKAEVDTLLIDKANSSDVYTKNEIDLKVNKEETQNALNKSLYNLGAFDTISGNVITRQTGYVDLGKLDYESNSGSFPSNSVYFPISRAKLNGRLSLSSSSLFNNVYLDTSSNLILLLNHTYNNANDLKSALSGIILQYELAASYTEEIIEGQPLITLDSQGSQWLRSEWEKGLNLAHEKFVDYNNNNGYLLNNSLKPNVQYTVQLVSTDYTDFRLNKYRKTNTTAAVSLPIATTTPLRVTQNDLDTYYICLYAKKISDDSYDGNFKIMLVEGNYVYPYQEYNGQIVHEKQLKELDDKIGDISTILDILNGEVL